MEGLWTISASSEPLVQQCIENAAKPDANNKWQRAFMRKSINSDKPIFVETTGENINATTGENINATAKQEPPFTIVDSATEPPKQEFGENEKNLCDLIETDVSRRFDHIVEECIKDSRLFAVIAEKVSEAAIEKFCKLIYEHKRTLHSGFITNYLNIFLPAFLSKSQSWYSIDLLTKASKIFPKEFKKELVPLIIKDVTLPNRILLSFIESLTNEEKTELMLIFSEMDITEESFIHHLNSISVLYKDCERHLTIQNFIFTSLKDFGDKCLTNKVYGRLLLSHIQTLTKENAKVSQLENIIDHHSTVFKKVCSTKLENLMRY